MTKDFLVQQQALAHAALPLWGFAADAGLDLLNYSENTTFAVTTAEGKRYVLRLYRLGHHSKAAIASELAWMKALHQDGALSMVSVIAGLDSQPIQQCQNSGHFLVLFAFLSGQEPEITADLRAPFTQLGQLAARAHLHSQNWQRPAFFTRPTWDDRSVFEPDPLWGHWRTGPNVTLAHCRILQKAQECLQERLRRYGKASEQFGLIHADMRLANLLVDNEATHVIDFDDCGFGWWMYDFAAAVSFFEDHPQIPALKRAWLEGYQRIRPLSQEDRAEIETMVLLRRMHLLGWLGTHQNTELFAELAPHFAEGTVKLASDWLELQTRDTV